MVESIGFVAPWFVGYPIGSPRHSDNLFVGAETCLMILEFFALSSDLLVGVFADPYKEVTRLGPY